MNSTQRWAIAIVVLVIALLWLFWPKGEQKSAPAKGPVAGAPADVKLVAAPASPRTEAPLSAIVLFEYNQATVRASEASKLDELASRLKSGSFDRVEAVGHADRIGGEGYNMKLSEQRAAAVRAHLAGKGVEAGRIRVEAKGEAQAVTGDACKNLGTENSGNRKLIDCLQRDRRVAIMAVAAR